MRIVPVKCKKTGKVIPVYDVDVIDWLESGAGEIVSADASADPKSEAKKEPAVQPVPGSEQKAGEPEADAAKKK